MIHLGKFQHLQILLGRPLKETLDFLQFSLDIIKISEIGTIPSSGLFLPCLSLTYILCLMYAQASEKD